MSDSVYSTDRSPTIESAGSKRPLATQQASLLRWLESSAKANPAPAKTARPIIAYQTGIDQTIRSPERVATLREALAANGLCLAPGIHQLPALHKIVRVEDLLRHDT